MVHPIREGNGRLARLLSLLMALQAGLPPLDFSPMLGRGQRIYIGAIHAAMGRDYQPLAAVFGKNYRAFKAARRCQYAMKVSRLAGALAAMPSENGARMPSTADDVLAEIRSAALRLASVRLRRYGLDSLSVMRQWYYSKISAAGPATGWPGTPPNCRRTGGIIPAREHHD